MDEAEEFSLICQSTEVSANPGDDVVLSCHLEPAISAASMEIKWWHSYRLVCLYKYGQVKKDRDYAGRVHFPLDLKKGNLSLKIRNVRRSQSGEYTCEVIHEQQVKKVHIHLHVKPVNFKLVVPNHTVYANQGENVILHVQFSPATNATPLTINWLKERVFIYEYVDGKETRNRHYEGRVHLNIQELERGNIFLTLESVQWSDSGNYTCQVNYEEYNGEKKIQLNVRDLLYSHSSVRMIRSTQMILNVPKSRLPSKVQDEDTNSPEGQEEVEETEQRAVTTTDINTPCLPHGTSSSTTFPVEEDSSIENTNQLREEIASDQEMPSTALQQDEEKKKKKKKSSSCVLL